MHHIDRILYSSTKKDFIENVIHQYKDALKNLDNCYIFGAGITGNKIADLLTEHNVRIKGFIDNRKKGELNGIPIFALQDIADKNETIIIGSVFQVEIYSQLLQNRYRNIIPYPVLYIVFDIERSKRDLAFGDIEDLSLYKNEYKEFYDTLADAVSQETFLNVLRYRSLLHPKYLSGIYRPLSEQYFDKIIMDILDTVEVFVDGGGYNGDSTLSFIAKKSGHFRKIYFYEPDREIIETAKSNLSKYSDKIEFLNKGLWDKNDVLYFKSTNDTTGKLGDESDYSYSIETCSIDGSIGEPVDYIKMDIEGAEYHALCGAVKQLKHTPVLAIGFYHSALDLWRLPKLIKQINPDYAFFVRHYSQTIFDTVLYCVGRTA